MEVFSLAVSADNCLIGVGCFESGSQNRSHLVKLDQSGSVAWERSYGFGESFRSIFASLCGDGGFCSVGGFIDENPMSYFPVRADSPGLVEEQGIKPDVEMPGKEEPLRSVNPMIGGIGSVVLILEGARRFEHNRSVGLEGLRTSVYLVTVRTYNASDALLLTVLRLGNN